MTSGRTEASVSQLRLFYALRPDEAMRARIAATAAALPATATQRPVSPDNYHLTLAFVGAVPAARLDELRELGRAVRATRCTLVFDAYEYWPKPEVVVAAARVIPGELERAWSELHLRLARARFELAPKRLRPHISLARKVTQAPVLPAMSAFSWTPRPAAPNPSIQ
jgi:2'-5' RNA ligase